MARNSGRTGAGEPSQAPLMRLRRLAEVIEDPLPGARSLAFDAMAGRRLALWRQAVAEVEDLLHLNPNDNRGIRYRPMGWPLVDGRGAGAAALPAFRRRGEADAARDRATAANPRPAGLGSGREPMPKAMPDALAWLACRAPAARRGGKGRRADI